jgi:hypothetical protein
VAALENGADDLGSEGWDPLYGWGRINAANSVHAPLQLTGALASSEIDDRLWKEAEQSAAFRPGEVIIKLRAGAGGMARQKLARYGVRDVRTTAELGLYLLRVPTGSEIVCAQELSGDVDVAYAHPNYLLHAARR